MKTMTILGLTMTSLLWADPIITTNGTPNTGSGIDPSQFMVLQFTLGSNYNNVAISAALASFASGDSGTAFLTNQIGPGTTVANQLATTNFNFALVSDLTTLVDVPLFSGLTLNAGTYDVVLTGPSPINDLISRNQSATYTTAAGASVATGFANTGNIDTTYSPASTFTLEGDTGLPLFFTVTGNQPNTVPEPSYAVLLLAGLGAMLLRWRRRLV
jgi:hypothetical protein